MATTTPQISRDYEAYLRRPARHVEPRAEMAKILHRHAIDQLAALARIPGALRIITYATDGYGNPLVHDIVRIEGPTPKGQFVGYTREGDNIRGEAPSLLARLTEANRIGTAWRQQERAERDGRRGLVSATGDAVFQAEVMRAAARR